MTSLLKFKQGLPWATIIIIFALSLRLLTYFSTDIGLSGDGYGYLARAEFIRNNFKFPDLSVQPIGYPLILSFLIQPDKTATIDHIARIQQLIDFMIVLSLIYFSKITLEKRFPLFFLGLSILFALQPFTALMASSLYTEQMISFFSFFGFLLICTSTYKSNYIMSYIIGGLLLGLSSTFRVDIFALNVFMLLFLIFIAAWKTVVSRASIKSWFKQGLILFLSFFAMPIFVLSAQFLSTHEFRFVDTSQYYTQGYYRWLSTWPADWHEHSQFAFYSNWTGGDINNYPDKAFENQEERESVAQLLNYWVSLSSTHYTASYKLDPDIDLGFYTLYLEKRNKNPIKYFILNPIYRMYHFWVNLEGGTFYIVPFQVTLPFSTMIVACVFLCRIIFIFLFLIGSLSVLSKEVKQQKAYHGWLRDFTLVSLVYVIMRTAELGLLSTLVGAGLMEIRFVLSATPFALVIVLEGAYALNQVFARLQQS